MYQHLVTTIEGRVLHFNKATGVVSDQDGDEVSAGETLTYIAEGKYHSFRVPSPNELRYQPLNPALVREER